MSYLEVEAHFVILNHIRKKIYND